MQIDSKVSNDWLLLMASGQLGNRLLRVVDKQEPNPLPNAWRPLKESDQIVLPDFTLPAIEPNVAGRIKLFLKKPWRGMSLTEKDQAIETVALLFEDIRRVKDEAYDTFYWEKGLGIMPNLQTGKYEWVKVFDFSGLSCSMCGNEATGGNLHYMEMFCGEDCHLDFLTMNK